jgi:hypothetical protein
MFLQTREMGTKGTTDFICTVPAAASASAAASLASAALLGEGRSTAFSLLVTPLLSIE